MTSFDTHSASLRLFRGTNTVDLGVEIGELASPSELSLSLDVDRNPYVQASFTIPRPSAALLADMDPRTYPVILVALTRRRSATEHLPATLGTVTDTYGDDTLADVTAGSGGGTEADVSADFPGTDVTTVWSPSEDPAAEGYSWFLYVTDLEEGYAPGTLRVTLASGEFRFDDHKRVASTTANMATIGNAHAIVSDLAARADGYLSWAGGSWTITGEPALWHPGESLSEFIDPILEAQNLRIYAESAHEYSVAAIGFHSGFGTTSHLDLDFEDNVFDASKTLSISANGVGWYDACLIIYRWTDAGGVQQVAYDRWPLSGANTKARVITREKAFPGAGAAQGIVGRSTQRGYTIGVTTAARYTLNPGWTCSMRLPDDPTPLDWAIKSVTFNLPEGEMTVTLQAIGA